MSHHTASKHDHRPSPGSGKNWPRPNQISERAQRIRRHWSDGECINRERLADRRLRELAEQLLR